jgi:multiple sugar transport system substrate-binding protein
MRRSVLDSKALEFGDILPLVREREVVYGRQVMALPLGCPPPLVAAIEGGQSIAVAPLADEFAAYALLARAAPMAHHASREALWFDAETMQPRLTEPPFVRALKEMSVASAAGTPCDVAGKLLAGELPVAIVWPCRTSAAVDASALFVRPLVAATEVFNPIAQQWEATPPRHVTLLATSGRLVGVSTTSRNAASAFRLAGWLASPEIVGQLVKSSNGLAICRGSQRKVADNWLGAGTSGSQFSEQVVAALSQRHGVAVPRLPGVDRYLQKLADAVRRAADGTATPEEALAAVATDWQQLTDEFGRDRQRLAYRRCLGIEP